MQVYLAFGLCINLPISSILEQSIAMYLDYYLVNLPVPITPVLIGSFQVIADNLNEQVNCCNMQQFSSLFFLKKNNNNNNKKYTYIRILDDDGGFDMLKSGVIESMLDRYTTPQIKSGTSRSRRSVK